MATSFFDSPFATSMMISAAEQQEAYYMKHVQEQMAHQIADRMAQEVAQEVAKNTTMKVYDRPDRHGSVEMRMEYIPPKCAFNAGVLSGRGSDYIHFDATDNIETKSIHNDSMFKLPSVNKSFSQWYRDLKQEINSWLN